LEPPKAIRVLLADDHAMFRAGIRGILRRQKGVEVIGEAEDGPTALRLSIELSPDIVLMDIAMPLVSGIETTRNIRSQSSAKVIILSMHSERQFVMEAIAAGASGYLLKDSAIRELTLAIAAAGRGEFYLTPKLEHDLDLLLAESASGSVDVLSPRERQVLGLLAQGNTSKAIGAALHISPKTVELHRGQIMKKLGIHSVAGLTKYAIRCGVATLE